MNNKGQAAMFGIMMFVFLIIVLSILVTPIKEIISDTRSTNGLDCEATNLTFGQSSACLITDIILPYFFIIILSIGGGLITTKAIGTTTG